MGKEQSVAPKDRVNITYKNADGGMNEDVELPNVLVALGDYGGEHGDKLRDRKTPEINKRNFDEVMASQKVSVKFGAKDVLSEDGEDREIPVELRFERMKDFDPESIAKQIPALNELLTLRQALIDLKTSFTDNPDVLENVKKLLKDDEARNKLLGELGMGGGE